MKKLFNKFLDWFVMIFLFRIPVLYKWHLLRLNEILFDIELLDIPGEKEIIIKKYKDKIEMAKKKIKARKAEGRQI
jgi:hypothetical protein